MNAGHVEIENLSHYFVSRRTGTAVQALDGVSMEIAGEEFVSLLGPSGCGKTTVMNIIAGFIRPQTGRVLLDGGPIGGPGAERGVVFQDLALFPWLTARGNVEFGLKLRKTRAAERARTSSHYLALMGILEHADRHVYELSGGMRQRVALARSLANDPQVLLMDEPFAAVDALTRRTLQKELVRIWETARKSVLFITHSVEEAVLVSDRVLVMSARPGRIIGNRRITLPRPRDEHSPEFAELRRELDGLLSHEDSPSEVEPVQAQTWTEGAIKGGTA